MAKFYFDGNHYYEGVRAEPLWMQTIGNILFNICRDVPGTYVIPQESFFALEAMWPEMSGHHEWKCLAGRRTFSIKGITLTFNGFVPHEQPVSA